MTAKESKAVAWRYRDRHEAEADVWNYLDLPPLMTYDYVEPLCLQSALHAAEADNKETERDRRRWAIRAEAAEAELLSLVEAAQPFATFNSSDPTITVRTPDITKLRAALHAARTHLGTNGEESK